jgi:hypothetical protein
MAVTGGWSFSARVGLAELESRRETDTPLRAAVTVGTGPSSERQHLGNGDVRMSTRLTTRSGQGSVAHLAGRGGG